MDQSQARSGECRSCAGVEGALHSYGMMPENQTCASCGHARYKDGDGACGVAEAKREKAGYAFIRSL